MEQRLTAYQFVCVLVVPRPCLCSHLVNLPSSCSLTSKISPHPYPNIYTAKTYFVFPTQTFYNFFQPQNIVLSQTCQQN